MARAAVKAKQAQKARKAQPAPKTRARGRRGHAAGGNPNHQLFFVRMRRSAKPVYVILAVLFAVTFAFLGVGSGSGGGLDQLFSGLNIFHSSGNSVSKALDEVKKDPNGAKGYRDLATAYESKGDTANAIGALQSYTGLRPKDAKAWSELAGLQLSQAQTYQQQYADAYAARQLAAPSTAFLPTGTLGTAIGTSPIEQAAASLTNSTLNNLAQQTQVAYAGAVTSYQKVTQLQPANADAQFQLAQAAQTAGSTTVAVEAYKAYLKLNPTSSSASQIRELIKQLSPPATTPAKKKTK